jgi:hypothetical protein
MAEATTDVGSPAAEKYQRARSKKWIGSSSA